LLLAQSRAEQKFTITRETKPGTEHFVSLKTDFDRQLERFAFRD